MKSLLQLIAEADDAVEDKPKKKFTVTVTDADGNEVQKTAMAYNIGDIKAYWASGARPDETFVKADLHDEELGEPPADDVDAPDDTGAAPDADDAVPTDDMTADDLPPGDEPDADDELPPDDGAAAEPDADDEELDDEGKPKKKAPKKKPKVDADAMAAVDEEDKKKAFDLQRVLYGAMSRKEFNDKWNKPAEKMTAQHKKMAGPGGLYQNLITGVPGADKKLSKLESFAAAGPMVTEGYSEDDIAIGGTVIYKSGKGYKYSQAKSKSFDNVKLVNGDSIAMSAVLSTDFSDWKQFKDKQVKESIVTAPAKDVAPAAKAARAAVKDEPKGMEYKEFYHKSDFPDVEFAWTTTYHSGNDLLAAIEKHHGVKPNDTKRLTVDKRDNYYIVKKGTMDVLGRVSVTDGGVRPGYGRVTHVEGNIAISAKAKKDRDENLYGFWVKPQHGSPHISVGTQHSYGPWSKFSAEANVRDKYEHFAYDDEFGHGTIHVVKVVKKDGKWVRA